jgi:acyl dehydratase
MSATSIFEAPASRPIRTFDWKAQEDFAHFSGDRNPMHMDAVFARRTPAGQPVVHGVHALLWALDVLTAQNASALQVTRIKARFAKFIYLGEPVELKVIHRDGAEIRAQILVDCAVVTSIQLRLGTPESRDFGSNREDATAPQLWPERPADPAFDEIHACGGYLPLQNPSTALDYFPELSAAIGADRVNGIASVSRVVGMVCPGLHSMLASLDLVLMAPVAGRDAIRHRVTKVDERFRLVVQSVEGSGWSGTVESYARTPPVEQPNIQDLAGIVAPAEFARTRALIIGGSRGLGELTAKLIAAGGGSVTITYARGQADALAVQRQIQNHGGICELIHYDATRPAMDQLRDTSLGYRSLYYFATTPIFRRHTRAYSKQVFEEFLHLYVDGFEEICMAALAYAEAGLSVFYPSSIAVENRPENMTEYAMAKAAGEILCCDLNRFVPALRIAMERLPRMQTDQTASVVPLAAASPVETMLRIVREVEPAAPAR